MSAEAQGQTPAPLALSTQRALDREWRLFADWCASWDLDLLEVNAGVVARFLAAFPAALSTSALRVRAIRQYYQSTGHPLPLPGIHRASDTLWRDGDELLDVTSAISQLPRYRFPVGLRGRRDAFVLLTASLGLTRQQIHQLTPADIHTGQDDVVMAGRDVGRSSRAVGCPRCVVVRWLAVLAPAWAGDRGRVRDILDVTCATPDIHDCDSELETGWEKADRVVVSLDTHGWVRPGVGLSTRTITTLVGPHRHRTEKTEAIPAAGSHTGGRVVSAVELYEEQDELDQKIAALLLQTATALAEAAAIHSNLNAVAGPN